MSFSLLGLGHGLPALSVSNDELSQMMDTNDEWIVTRTGISSRRVVTSETMALLCTQAARNALEAAKLEPGQLDLILCATIQGDYITPSMACIIQREIGASCPAFDINAACCGFLFGLDVAESYFKAGRVRHVLVVAMENMSRHVNWEDRATCVLFGDGAGAAVLGAGEALRYIRLTSRGEIENLYIPAYRLPTPFAEDTGPQPPVVYMNGQNIFKFAVNTCLEEIHTALENQGLTPDDIDHYLLHQANGRIVDTIRRKLGQPEEKFPLIIGHTGNISAACLPILLDEQVCGGHIKPGQRVLLAAFGAGLTTATAVFVWEDTAHG